MSEHSQKIVDAPFVRTWANSVAARFAAHVYLVGTAIDKPDARDVDIRVVLTDDQYTARYGTRGWIEKHITGEVPSDGLCRWIADCAKLGDWVSRYSKLNIDFQIQHEQEVKHYSYTHNARVQLDDLELTLASPDVVEMIDALEGER